MKKEEYWNLGINKDAGTSTTPRKRATPKKAAKAEDNDDDEEDLTTPSKKKTPLNKVANGRISKKKAASSFSAADLIKSEDWEMSSEAVETEYSPSSYNMGSFSKEQAESKAASFYQSENDEA